MLVPEPKESPEFLKFWSLYPKKTDKGHARAALSKALRKATIETILDALQRQLRARAILGGRKQFVPNLKNPATWLNGECWDDHMEANLAAEVEQHLAHERRIREERVQAAKNPVACRLADEKRSDLQKAREAWDRLPTVEKNRLWKECAAAQGCVTYERAVWYFWEKRDETLA